MEYKYHSDEFKELDVEAAEREDAPNRCVGVLHPGPGQQYPFAPMSKFSHSYGMDSFGLDMPSFGKVKTLEKSQSRIKIENLYEARSKPIPLPHLQEMPIWELKSPYNKTQVIILEKPDGLSEDECKKYIRETFGISYGVLQDMAPAVTFKPNAKDLKCKGSFTQDFCSCRFEAQIWRVDAAFVGEENVHIFEFRRKSLSGKDAFEYLIRKMGAALKEAGRARLYGNGVEICPPAEDMIPDDLGDLAMPSFGGMGSHTSISQGNSDGGFPITLENEEQMDRWCKIIAERQWPAYEETLRLLARCCCDTENKKILAEHLDLQKVLIKELQLGSDATNCHNVLTIMFAILEVASSEQSIVEDGILLAVVEALMTHSGLKQQVGAPKVARSVALERAALKVLMLVSEKPKHYNQTQVQRVLRVLGEAPRKLKDEVNQQHLEYVIGNLRKHTQ